MAATLPGTSGAGLTTRRAPFIEKAQALGQLYIHQPYELYSEENHQTWAKLYGRIQPLWHRYANENFLDGLRAIALDPCRVPRLDQVNHFLLPLTGFQAKAVSGYIPAFLFFDSLRRREFPTTVTVRPANELDYLPEPDIFHDLAGHVPMHTQRAFADALVRFGDCAHTAADLVSGIRDEREKLTRLENIIRAMARFFWFTVEFGLLRERDGLKACGSGLLSSFGELSHSIESARVHRVPIRLEWAIHQQFEIDRYQPLLFVLDSFDHLFDLADQLEKWMRAGKLDNVAPGEPHVNEEDLRSFLNAKPGVSPAV
jgi:phenylalanine-4-hydroxylase